MEPGLDIDTVIIGGGQAGLAASRSLQELGVGHVVLERGSVGQSWRSQRWNSFHLNTPNVVNVLPGDTYRGDDPLGFTSHRDLLGYFEEYRARHALPVEEGAEVTALRRVDDGFEVVANGEIRRCRNVILCSGDQNRPRTPKLAGEFPADLTQLHAADYREPDRLPAGAVLVVGSGQSGVQIVEDLLESGREVYLSTSAVGRIPRRYRGRDIFEWMQIAGLVDQRPEDLENPAELNAKQPQVSGTRGGHTVSLHQLARDGVTLLGRLGAVRGRKLDFDGDLQDNVATGDAVAAKIRGLVDMVVARSGMEAPAAEPDPVEAPFEGLPAMCSLRELDLDETAIRSLIWATGFGPGFDFLDPALRDASGAPRHRHGIGAVPGLYCLGFTWLRRRASGLIAGVSKDAQEIAAHIAENRGPYRGA